MILNRKFTFPHKISGCFSLQRLLVRGFEIGGSINKRELRGEEPFPGDHIHSGRMPLHSHFPPLLYEEEDDRR